MTNGAESPLTIAGRVSSFEMTSSEWAGPRVRAVTDLYNAYHEAVDRGDRKLIEQLDASIGEALDEYFSDPEFTEHPSPDMMRGIMLSGRACARGEYEAALEFELAAMRATRGPGLQLEHPEMAEHYTAIISYNLSMIYRRLGRLDKAIEAAATAIEIRPSDPLNHLEMVINTAAAGDPDQAEALLQLLADVPEYDRSRNDGFAAALAYEREFHDLDLPSVRTILDRLKEGGWP